MTGNYHMAKRGPKPKPTVLKRLAGSQRADANKKEPEFASYIPDPPEDIANHELMLNDWNKHASMLYTAGLLTIADGEAFAMLVRALNEIRVVNEVLNRGYLVEINDGKTLTLHPYFKVRADAQATVKHLFAEFGMTPASRTRIEVQFVPPPTLNPKKVDPIDDMLGEG